MGFNSRWIILLLLIIIILLLIHSQWICQSCVDCKNTELSDTNHNKIRQHSEVDKLIKQILPDASDRKNNKTFNAIKPKETHNSPVQVVQAEIEPSSSLDPLRLGQKGIVLDCISWDERWRYNTSQVTLQDYQPLESAENEDPNHRKRTFQTIFERRDWPGANDTLYYGLKASGPGAAIRNAQGIIAVLHSLVTRLKTSLNKARISILDVACGDLQWMVRFLDTRWDLDYTGADVVPELISHHRKEFKRIKNARFIVRDFVTEPPDRSYDLIICRDVLQHLWLGDAAKALKSLSIGGSRFLLATTFRATQRNIDVERNELGGRFSGYNLELSPFSLAPPLCASFDWGVEQLGLWALPLQQTVTL